MHRGGRGGGGGGVCIPLERTSDHYMGTPVYLEGNHWTPEVPILPTFPTVAGDP